MRHWQLASKPLVSRGPAPDGMPSFASSGLLDTGTWGKHADGGPSFSVPAPPTQTHSELPLGSRRFDAGTLDSASLRWICRVL